MIIIKTRIPTNLNIVIILSFFSLLLFFVCSCNRIIEKNKYDGTWILKGQNYSETIILNDENYNKDYSSDDLKVSSSGKFYLNRNENRVGITISLIPNKIISGKDTIFQECENLDIIEVNDNNLTIQKSNQWERDKNNRFTREDQILVYEKQ